MKNSFLINLFILVFSLSGAYFCSELLYKDIYETKSVAGNQEEAGTLKNANINVKRKFSENLLWDRIDNQTKLYWNDSVQTDERSQAIIQLKDGSEIKLGISSLISLEKDKDKLSLSLKSGQMLVDSRDTKSKSMAQIKVNGVTLNNTQGKSIVLNIDEKKGQVTAIATSADGSAGVQTTISKDGKVEEKEVAASLNLPPPLFRKLTDNNKEIIDFSWLAKNHQSILEVSTDKDFKKIISAQKGSDGKAQLTLHPGFYYWRVKLSSGKDSLFSESRSFDIVQMTKPIPLTPAMSSQNLYRREIPTMEFSWKPSEQSNKYILEVSSDRDFKNIMLTQEVKGTSYQTSKLKDGPVYWRISAVYENEKRTSLVSDFEIKKMQDIPPPILQEPAHQFVVDYEFYHAYQGIPFKWKFESKENYRFVLASSSDLKNEVTAIETTQPETLIKDQLKPGTYFWAVGFKNLDGEWSYKEIRKLEVAPLIPVLVPPRLLTQKSEFDLDETPEIKLQWAKVEGAKQYKFKLIKVDNDKDKLLLEENTAVLEKSKNDLEDGTYKYIVSSIDDFGRESKAVEKTFKVFRGPTLEAPDFEMSEVQ